MTEMWEPTIIEMDAVDRKEKPIHLKDVPAIKNKKTGTVCVDPEDVARVELEQIARENGLTDPRDLSLLLMLYAKPLVAKTQDIEWRYHLNKMLFYQWKNMEKEGLGNAFPHDKFLPKKRGPLPEHVNADLKKLEEQGFVKTEMKRWGKGTVDESMKICLTPEGQKLAESLWYSMPEIFQSETLGAKARIFALTPEKVKELVHKEYPEYRKTYLEEDKS